MTLLKSPITMLIPFEEKWSGDITLSPMPIGTGHPKINEEAELADRQPENG